MKIKELEYENKTSKWKLEKTNFSDLTLLVGISGVGKTRILNSIWNLKEIAKGESGNGIKWNINFITNEDSEYSWSGEYEHKVLPKQFYLLEKFDNQKENDENKPKLKAEKIIKNGETIVERITRKNSSVIFLKGKETPKLSPFESVISLFSQEDDISSAYQEFKRIIKSNFSEAAIRVGTSYDKELKRKPSLEEIRESHLSSEMKVGLLYNLYPKEFNKIKNHFIDVFPQISDVRLKIERDMPFFDTYPFLEIREKGVKNWISQSSLSSGMYKTFMHISELFILPRGTVVLIDEFENSLGVNCIDVLTEDLLQESRNIQFIVTSHHPYIINNISPKYWKIVTRKGGTVTTKDAKNLGFDKSKHKAFLQLLNLEEYSEGVLTS